MTDSTEQIRTELKELREDDNLDVSKEAALVTTLIAYGVRALLLIVDLMTEKKR